MEATTQPEPKFRLPALRSLGELADRSPVIVIDSREPSPTYSGIAVREVSENSKKISALVFAERFILKIGPYVLDYRCSGVTLKSDQSSLEDVAQRFHTTRWTAVLLSGQSQAPGFQRPESPD